MDPNLIRFVLMSLVGFLIAVTVHEFAHARAALAAGDDTALRLGRVSLNPIDHLDTLGTIMFILTTINGFGLAWGKPVPVNPLNFKSPRWDPLRVSIWGPLANLITACALTLILRLLIVPYAPDYMNMVVLCITFNVMLAVFNMLPIGPLDGSKVFSSLLPVESAHRYELFMARYGLMIFLAMLFIRIPGKGSLIGLLIQEPVMFIVKGLMKLAYWHPHIHAVIQ